LGPRRAFWERLFEGEIGQLVLEGRHSEADAALKLALSRGMTRQQRVALIAAGDSDPDRLAVDAVRWLGRADVVLHESAVGAALLGLARRDAERVDIQALSVAGGWSLQMLTDAIVARVRKGERVCLLRRGDPYARGASEEALWLRTEGVGVLIFRPSPARLEFLGNRVSELDL
jgi:uroporphyrin-III C-methyltransferase/precorrin-2 dehydrogenase/sirohydrochlorin ferrochelatase